MAENKNIASSWLQQQAQKELGNTATADVQASAPKMVSSTQTGGASAWLKQQVGKTKVDYLQENYDRIKAEWDAAYGKEGWAELDFDGKITPEEIFSDISDFARHLFFVIFKLNFLSGI